MRPVRIVIVDKNDITRKGMEGIIGDAEEPYEVVAVFQVLRDAEDYVGDHLVDLLVIDDTGLRTAEIVRLVSCSYEIHPGRHRGSEPATGWRVHPTGYALWECGVHYQKR